MGSDNGNNSLSTHLASTNLSSGVTVIFARNTSVKNKVECN